MINVSELISDPDFAVKYKVHRQTSKFFKGRIVNEEKTLIYRGIVQSASSDDLEQLPEGDRQMGLMKFFCTPPNDLHLTSSAVIENENGEPESVTISDKVEYEGVLYKLISISHWGTNGYIKAFGCRTAVNVLNVEDH